jgi:hypothetical protein
MALPDNLKIEKLSREMTEKRKNGRNIFLRQHLNENYPEFYSENPDFRLEKYYAEMGWNYHNMTVKQAIDMAEGDLAYKFLWTETVLPALFEGVYVSADYRYLLASSNPDNASQVTQPYIEAENIRQSHGKKNITPPGVEPDINEIGVSGKTKSPQKYMTAYGLKYETIQDCQLSVLAEFLKIYTEVEDSGKLDDVIDTIVNGDGAIDPATKQTVDSSAAEIGVLDTETGLTFADYEQTCIRFSKIKRPLDLCIGSETTIRNIRNWNEFKIPYQGTPIHDFKIMGIDPLARDGIIYDDMENKILLVCKKACVTEKVKQGLLIEEERLVTKQKIIVVLSERLSFLNVLRSSKVIIDPAKAFASYGFPAYLGLKKAK